LPPAAGLRRKKEFLGINASLGNLKNDPVLSMREGEMGSWEPGILWTEDLCKRELFQSRKMGLNYIIDLTVLSDIFDALKNLLMNFNRHGNNPQDFPSCKIYRGTTIMVNDDRNMTRKEWKEKYREQRIRHDPDAPHPAPRVVEPKGSRPVNYRPTSRFRLAVFNAIKYAIVLMLFLGVGEWLSEHKIDVAWLIKAGVLGAIIGFIIAILSKTGKIFD
jgi:hypothetical protein